jgi:signal transduction histidine kinase
MTAPAATIAPGTTSGEAARERVVAVSPARAENSRILLIEDDSLCVELTRAILVDRGFAHELTMIAGSMDEAANALQCLDIDVVLADLTLPDAYGLDVIHRCRTIDPNVPIIVLTGNDDMELALEALAIGAEDYLVKAEFDDEKLMRSIRYSLARAQSQRQLRATLEQLEESNRQLEQYATIASHDLRSPVRTARVLVGRMIGSQAKSVDPATVTLGEALEGCLSRIEMMLEGLFEYAQVRDLSLSGELRDEHIGAVARDVLADLDADLRACDATVDIVGDEIVRVHTVLLRSVLMNVVRNAVKYRAARPLHIVVTSEPAGDNMVLVRVGDNGIGIDPRFRTRVFQMFERISKAGEGIGLGLTLCHRAVMLHGGRIWIEDGPAGVGTTMCFTLPAGRASAPS